MRENLRLNLARRPFAESRAVFAVLAALAVAVTAMTVLNVLKYGRYVDSSAKTRATIETLQSQIDEARRAASESERTTAVLGTPELAERVDQVNQLVHRRSFSWTLFLTRLEQVLPWDHRIVSIAPQIDAGPTGAREVAVNLQIVTRKADGLPELVRAFVASPWFDRPVPASETSQEAGVPEGRTLSISVTYHEEGKAGQP